MTIPFLLQTRTLVQALAFAAFVCALTAVALPAAADDAPPVDLATKESGAGLGFAMRSERSMYRGGGTRNDLVPIYLYEGKRLFLESYRGGIRLDQSNEHRLEVFLAHRFEGFPYDRIPASLAGMAERGSGLDMGIAYQRRGPWGMAFAELLRDASRESRGTEARIGYRYDMHAGRLTVRPQIAFSLRDAKLNNYYYGVRASEATATRPAFEPGAGTNGQIGLDASYRLSERWRVFGGINATRWSAGVAASPIVDKRTQVAAFTGLAYDFSPSHDAWPDGRPLIVKVLYGKSTDCDVAKVMLLKCVSTNTVDQTRVESVELGRPFIERLNGWPVDVVGMVGLLHHSEKGLQPDSWQVNAYMKGFYYGFPWAERVKTRLGFGVGLSYANRVPFVEMRDQIARGRNSSRVLNYLDPTVDVSVGDLIGVKSMKETYLGVGVSHRSGIFGTSSLLGNVNGGSNYIYSYLEWRM
jgi:outer membrane protein